MIAHDFERAIQYAIQRLERELSPQLRYHGVDHTRSDVVQAAGLLAEMEGVDAEARRLVLTAAWFHDIGFIYQVANHEAVSAEVAEKVLPECGYSAAEVDTVRRAILITKIPQSPTTLLEKIVADADLNVLGREDFMHRNGHLREELAFLGNHYTDLEWYTAQLAFVEQHRFFTPSAVLRWNFGKMQNILQLKKIVAGLSKP